MWTQWHYKLAVAGKCKYGFKIALPDHLWNAWLTAVHLNLLVSASCPTAPWRSRTNVAERSSATRSRTAATRPASSTSFPSSAGTWSAGTCRRRSGTTCSVPRATWEWPTWTAATSWWRSRCSTSCPPRTVWLRCSSRTTKCLRSLWCQVCGKVCSGVIVIQRLEEIQKKLSGHIFLKHLFSH